MSGQFIRSSPSGQTAKYTSRQRRNSSPPNSSATPSYCKVRSPVQPITNAAAGFARKFAYFRELRTVSKTISSSAVTAIPTSAD